MAEQAKDIVDYRPGLRAYTTPAGIRTIELDYWADPTHDEAWVQDVKKLYITSKDWRREMCRDWSSPAGDPYFPIFSEIGRDRYIHMAERLIKGPVFRSLDFGGRRPACTWFQYSEKSDRVWLLREFMPHDLLTVPFREAVKFLSGEIPYESLPNTAQHWVDVYGAKPEGHHCPPPWFPPGTLFINIGGKEAMQGQSNSSSPEEHTVAEIFAAGGVQLLMVNPRVLGRNRLVGRTLDLRSDSWPGLFIDPQCEEMIQGFEGAFCYPSATMSVPVPVHPKDDGHFINLLDAFGYGIAAVVPVDAEKPEAPPRLLGYNGREPIYAQKETEQVGWSETRGRK